jgi:phage terminase large subunit-like protein
MVSDYRKILLEQVEDDSVFFIPFELDEDDDYTDPKNWPKANPNFGISVTERYLQSVVKLAERSPSKKNNILTKHFNIFTSVGNHYFNIVEWNKNKLEEIPRDIEVAPMYLGLDLSSKVDLSATVGVFECLDENGEVYYFVQGVGYLPLETIQEQKNATFYEWNEKGYLQACYGKTIDFEQIKGDIIQISKENNLVEIAFDPWNCHFLASQIEKDIGNPELLVEYRQTVQNYSEVMKWVQALIIEGKIKHDGNPLMSWCLGNVVAKEDLKANVFPRKENEESKIDLAIAMLMAFGRIMYHKEDQESTYEDKDLLIF